MPEKWDTLLNSGANNISGGQKKRLDIIRGIVKDTDVIIFDESTAYLDIEKRKALFKVVNMIKKDKIIIFITHNLEEVSNYNVIYAFEKGKIKKIESKYVQEIYKWFDHYFYNYSLENKLKERDDSTGTVLI